MEYISALLAVQIDRLVRAGANVLAPIPVGLQHQIGTVVDYAYHIYNFVGVIVHRMPFVVPHKDCKFC